MSIKRILVSQPAPPTDRSPFTDLNTKHKVELVFRPFIEVQGVEAKEFRKQKIGILDHSAVIVTSRTAVDHFFRICEECRIIVPETMKYFCMSEAIALYLQKYIVYRKRKIFFGSGNFEALMDVIAKHKDERYLVLLSSPHNPQIPVMLGKSGVKHNTVILSYTVSGDLTDINPNQFDILALYSPADVTSFLANFPEIEHKFKIAVFGAGTAKAMLEAGIKIDIMAPTPKYPSMITALDKFIGCLNAGEDVSSFALTSLPKEQSARTVKKTKIKHNSDVKTASAK